MGANSTPAQPSNGSSAPLRLASRAGAMAPSSAIRHRIAAPAECPTTSCGARPSVRSSSARACATPGNDRRASGNASLKPWPGRSGATTV
jgi:hypothetical protein